MVSATTSNNTRIEGRPGGPLDGSLKVHAVTLEPELAKNTLFNHGFPSGTLCLIVLFTFSIMVSRVARCALSFCSHFRSWFLKWHAVPCLDGSRWADVPSFTFFVLSPPADLHAVQNCCLCTGPAGSIPRLFLLLRKPRRRPVAVVPFWTGDVFLQRATPYW